MTHVYMTWKFQANRPAVAEMRAKNRAQLANCLICAFSHDNSGTEANLLIRFFALFRYGPRLHDLKISGKSTYSCGNESDKPCAASQLPHFVRFLTITRAPKRIS